MGLGSDNRGVVQRPSATSVGARARSLAVWFHRSRLAPPVEALGFWLAVLLPLVYLPLVFLGFPTRYGYPAFLGLLALHLVALSVGYAHEG